MQPYRSKGGTSPPDPQLHRCWERKEAREDVWIVIPKSGKDRCNTTNRRPPSPRRFAPPLDTLSKISTEKWALQGEIPIPSRCRSLLWLGWDRRREQNWMDERSPFRMGFTFSQRFSFVPRPRERAFPSNTLHFAHTCFTDNEELLLYRLYSKGRVLGHKRAKRNTRPNTSLLQIEGVGSKEEAQFYLGKVLRPPLSRFSSKNSDLLRITQRVAYVYRAKKQRQGSNVRVIWGYVSRPAHLCASSHLVTNGRSSAISLALTGVLVL